MSIEKLSEEIHNEMIGAGGVLSFARFMQLALYSPQLGYYNTELDKFGKKGDFITAPEISPLFAQCIAKQCQQILMALGGGDMLEFGAGSGIFAREVLLALEKLNCLPNHYFILEVSQALRAQQSDLLNAACPHLMARISWLDQLPDSISGIVFANEVLDAMPVHCFQYEAQQIFERCVCWEQHRFSWCLRPAADELLHSVETILSDIALPSGYQSEISLCQSTWIQEVASRLTQGTILLLDYGYGRREYYHPDRTQGTLMCFYQHQYHADPLIMPGQQDITAHVDFTRIAESALDAGLTLAGYTTQASFLFNCGLLEPASVTLSAVEHFQRNQAIKKLTLPSQMGEIIKVIGLSKDLDLPLIGFSSASRTMNL